MATAYLWHNYGKPTIGSRADIERVPAPTLRAVLREVLPARRRRAVVSGKFDEAAALASIEKTFGAIPKPARVLAGSYTVEPAQDGEREVTLRRKGDVSVVETAYHGVSGVSPDSPALEAAADILTREPSGRLYKKLVETKLAASVSGYARQMHDPGLVQFSAQVRDPKNVDKVEHILESEVEGLASSKIDPKELERWRTSTQKEIELALANSQEVAVFMSEFVALGDWRTLFAYRDAVKRVQIADVQRVAKEYFKPSNRTVGKFLPIAGTVDRAPLTERGNVEDYVKDVKEGEVKDRGEQFAATLDNIEARTTRKQLAGGIKAAFLAKKTRGGTVHLALHLHWGTPAALQGKRSAAAMMGALMMRGTTKKSLQELKDLEDQLKAHLDISTDADGMQIEIETVRDHLPAVLDLAAEIADLAELPRQGARGRPPGAAREPRGPAAQPAGGRVFRARSPDLEVAQGRSALHADHEGADRRAQGREARRHQAVLQGLRRRRARRARGRR